MTTALPIPNELISLVSCDGTGRLIWNTRGDKWFDSRYAGRDANQVINGGGYQTVKLLGRSFLVHRVIWKLNGGGDPEVVDHINGDRLDNRLSNLRAATITQNQRNTMPRGGASKYKGVYAARGGRWGSRIKLDGKTKHLGTYDCEKQAANAYDMAAIEMHGDFARTNRSLGLFSK